MVQYDQYPAPKYPISSMAGNVVAEPRPAIWTTPACPSVACPSFEGLACNVQQPPLSTSAKATMPVGSTPQGLGTHVAGMDAMLMYIPNRTSTSSTLIQYGLLGHTPKGTGCD